MFHIRIAQCGGESLVPVNDTGGRGFLNDMAIADHGVFGDDHTAALRNGFAVFAVGHYHHAAGRIRGKDLAGLQVGACRPGLGYGHE